MPGREEEGAIAGRRRLQVSVVIGVAEVGWKHIVIYIADGALGTDAVDAHSLELQPRHRTRSVLCQRVVDADADLRSGHHLTFDQVLGDDLLGQRLAHAFLLVSPIIDGAVYTVFGSDIG